MSSEIGRRELMKRTGAMAAALGAIGAGATSVEPRLSPVGRAEAFPHLAVAGAAAAGATGWTLRDLEVLGSDDPPEGLTPEALLDEIYNAANTRKNDNGSTFVDNKNILDGAEHVAYADAKIAAIEALNDQEPQDDVQEAATEEVDSYFTTLLENFFKGWNETVQEAYTFFEAIDEYDDLSRQDEFGWDIDGASAGSKDNLPEEITQEEYEMPDGSTFEIDQLFADNIGTLSSSGGETQSATFYWDPTQMGNTRPDDVYMYVETEYRDQINWMSYLEWNDIYEKIIDVYDDVSDGIVLWVNEVYDDVQSGDLDTDELLTPREQSEMTSDDEDFPQAIADLLALNYSVDLEREAEIYVEEIGATMKGQLAVSDDVTLKAGDTIDPDDEDEDYWLTYDVAEAEGEWEAFDDDKGVDGGEIEITEEPIEGTELVVDTSAGETAVVEYDEFVPLDEDGDELDPDDDDFDPEDVENYGADIGSQLDDYNTDIDEIRFYPVETETEMVTVLLEDTFEIRAFRDSDGEEVDESEYSSGDPHEDDNYITEEEWQEQQDRHEELIERYEESLEDDGFFGGGGFDIGADFGFLSNEFAGLPAWLWAIVLGAAAAVFGGD